MNSKVELLLNLGADPNATTWLDRTNYFETFPANDESLKWALELEADRMVHSVIAKKDLDSEMTVVRNEFELGENDPAGILVERALSTAFLWHNYGHLPIGSEGALRSLDEAARVALPGRLGLPQSQSGRWWAPPILMATATPTFSGAIRPRAPPRSGS